MSQACCPEGTPSSSQAQTHDLTAGNGPQVYTTVGSCSALEAHWPRAGWCCTHTLTLYSDMSHPVLGCALQLAHLGADEGDVSLLAASRSVQQLLPPNTFAQNTLSIPSGANSGYSASSTQLASPRSRGVLKESILHLLQKHPLGAAHCLGLGPGPREGDPRDSCCAHSGQTGKPS